MSGTVKVDVQQLIDSGRFSRHQFLIAFLCFVIIAIDGFDTAIIGFIAPSLRTEWQLLPQQLAPLMAAGLVGLVWSLLSWAQVDFGPLRYPLLLRVLTLSLTGIAVGFQLGFTAFLSAMIDLPIRRGEPGAH